MTTPLQGVGRVFESPWAHLFFKKKFRNISSASSIVVIMGPCQGFDPSSSLGWRRITLISPQPLSFLMHHLKGLGFR